MIDTCQMEPGGARRWDWLHVDGLTPPPPLPSHTISDSLETVPLTSFSFYSSESHHWLYPHTQYRVAQFKRPRILGDQQISEDNQELRSDILWKNWPKHFHPNKSFNLIFSYQQKQQYEN